MTSSSAAPIRLGIAGLGAVAQSVYLPLLARIPERFVIAAVCELSPSTRDTMAARYGVPPHARHPSLEAMLAAGNLDALVILTSGSHAHAVAMALEAGVAVLCEKPLAYTLAEVDALAAVKARTGGRLLLGYMKQYDPAVAEAARIVGGPDPAVGGTLRAVEITVLHPSSESQLAFAHLLPPATDIAPDVLAALVADLRAQHEAALGPAAGRIGELYTDILLGSVVHDLAVVRHIAGDPVSIDMAEIWPDGAWPPSLAITGRFAAGARLSIGWHYLPDYPAYREDVRFHYDRGSVELSFPTPYRLHLPTGLVVSTGGGETRRRIHLDAIEEAFELQLLAFEELVRRGTAPLAGIAEGRTDIVTCQRIAARLASGLGQVIGGEAAMGGEAAIGGGMTIGASGGRGATQA